MNDLLVYPSFMFVSLRCNCATLTLASAAKEKEEAIVWLQEYPSFLFSTVQCDIEYIKSTIIFYKEKNPPHRVNIDLQKLKT